MKLGQVDWRKDTITIVQQKTRHLLILPLLPDAGNSLASYILDERPIPAAGCEDYIFLRHQAPFHNLRTVYPLTRKLLESLHIQPVNTNKSGGLHLLRHSLVYRLLKKKVPDYTITKVLGHASKESDKPYLSLDERMLKECAMQIPSLALGYGGFLQ
jgi:integrase